MIAARHSVRQFQDKAVDREIVELSAAHGRSVGRYHLMTAQNPVFVISMTGGMCCVE